MTQEAEKTAPKGPPRAKRPTKPAANPHTKRGQDRQAGSAHRENANEGWVWGLHAGAAVLANPARDIFDVRATRNALRALSETDAETRDAATARLPGDMEPVNPRDLDRQLPAGAVHQGLAVRCSAPANVDLMALARPQGKEAQGGLLVIFDQVTDPHNFGAVARSALAFGALGLVAQDRKSPPPFGACAKAAVGALERLDVARVVNVARAITVLREAGWPVLGLSGQGATRLEPALQDAIAQAPRLALVVGAEAKGLRPGVAQACSGLASIAMTGHVDSLNVSTAAAIGLYAARNALGPTDL